MARKQKSKFPKLSPVQIQAVLCIGGLEHKEGKAVKYAGKVYKEFSSLAVKNYRVGAYSSTKDLPVATVEGLEKKGILLTVKEGTPYKFNKFANLTSLGWDMFDQLASENQAEHVAHEKELDRIRAENQATVCYTVTLKKTRKVVQTQRHSITMIAETEAEAVEKVLKKGMPYSKYWFDNVEETFEPAVEKVEAMNTDSQKSAIYNYERQHPAPESFVGVKEYLEATKGGSK